MKLRLKYGLKMLLRNPVRIIASLLTAIIVFGIAGLCIFTWNYDTTEWEKEILRDHWQDKYFNIGTSSDWPALVVYTIEDDDLDRFREIGCGYAYLTQRYIGSTPYPEQEVGAYRLGDHFGGDGARMFGEYSGQELFAPYAFCPDGLDYVASAANQAIYSGFFRMHTIYSGESALEEFGYELVGKLPEQKNEVAIPQWMYNSFLCYGYKDRSGNLYEINSEADIIGKTITLTDDNSALMDATIVGVVHTDLEEEQFLTKNMEWREDLGGIGVLSMLYATPPHLGLILSWDYWESRKGNIRGQVIATHDSPYLEEIIDYLVDWQKDISYGEYWYQVDDSPHVVYKQPHIGSSGLLVTGVLSRVYRETSIYFQMIPYLGIFAAVLLMYLCFSTVMGKRRGVGIMQSMGANKWQMILTIGVPILLFCLMCSLGALCVELGFLSYMNGRLLTFAAESEAFLRYYSVGLPSPFTISWQTWLFTFGVPLLIAAVTTLVTVWLVFRTPVVDNLNKKDFRLFSKRTKGVASRSIFSPPSSKD